MSLTSDMKDELARSVVPSQSAMAAEVCAILRFSGGLHLVGGRILIEAELDSSVAVRRLRAFLTSLYNVESFVVVVSGSSLRRGKRYVVRVVHRADELARLTGRGCVARCFSCPRFSSRAWTLLVFGNHMPGSRGCTRDGGARP